MGTSSRVVLITGASSGLGLEIAKRLLGRSNFHLFLTARKESLGRFAAAQIVESENVSLRALDVRSKADRDAVMAEIETRFGALDVLVNNAGFTFRSVLEHVTQDDLLEQMITNFWGPMELARGFLPQMRARRAGKIINISSVGGMMAMPTMAIYSASKFALEGASESLYYEVKPWNINVTLIEPGFIHSESFKNVRYTTLSGSSMRDAGEPYYGHYRFMTAFIERLMKTSPATATAVAKKVEAVIEAKNPGLRVAATPDAYLFDLIRRLLPRRFYHWILYRLLPYPGCWGDVNRLHRRCALELKKRSYLD